MLRRLLLLGRRVCVGVNLRMTRDLGEQNLRLFEASRKAVASQNPEPPTCPRCQQSDMVDADRFTAFCNRCGKMFALGVKAPDRQ